MSDGLPGLISSHSRKLETICWGTRPTRYTSLGYKDGLSLHQPMTLATVTQSNSYTEVFMSAEENKGKITPLMYFLICCTVQTLLISSLQKKKKVIWRRFAWCIIIVTSQTLPHPYSGSPQNWSSRQHLGNFWVKDLIIGIIFCTHKVYPLNRWLLSPSQAEIWKRTMQSLISKIWVFKR